MVGQQKSYIDSVKKLLWCILHLLWWCEVKIEDILYLIVFQHLKNVATFGGGGGGFYKNHVLWKVHKRRITERDNF